MAVIFGRTFESNQSIAECIRKSTAKQLGGFTVAPCWMQTTRCSLDASQLTLFVLPHARTFDRHRSSVPWTSPLVTLFASGTRDFRQTSFEKSGREERRLYTGTGIRKYLLCADICSGRPRFAVVAVKPTRMIDNVSTWLLSCFLCARDGLFLSATSCIEDRAVCIHEKNLTPVTARLLGVAVPLGSGNLCEYQVKSFSQLGWLLPSTRL